MSLRRPKVLILDGMWNKSLAAVRSLGSRGFHVTAGERTCLATALFSRYCSRRIVYPSPHDTPDEFLEYLVRELAVGSYNAVLPMEWKTQELLTEPSNRQRLQRYAAIPFADAGLARFLNDKGELMRYAEDHGFDIPRTYFPEDMDEVVKLAPGLDYPVVIKPRTSSGSRGLAYAMDRQNLFDLYEKIHTSYPNPIIQECVPPDGESLGVCLLMNNRSETRASFVYRRLRSYPVSGGPSTLRESIRKDDVMRIAESLLRSIGWNGVAHVEFKVDPRDGRPKLLEVNPRFWGSLALSIEAGVDFPYLLYRMALDGDIKPVTDYKTGVRCRWLIPGDMLHFISNPDRFRLDPSFFDFRPKDDIISRRDPMPTLGRLLSVFTIISDRQMRGLLKR